MLAKNEKRTMILKILSRRRHTLTEIANELDTSLSNAKEHLSKLMEANLLVKREEGRKWKYYELITDEKNKFGI